MRENPPTTPALCATPPPAGGEAPTTPLATRAPRPANRTEAAGVRRLEGTQAPSSKSCLTLAKEGNQPAGAVARSRRSIIDWLMSEDRSDLNLRCGNGLSSTAGVRLAD